MIKEIAVIINVIPLISAVVSLVFAVTVLGQFFAKRKSYQLIWAIGLFMIQPGIGRLRLALSLNKVGE